ncbi:MAG: hypothetical protein KGL58_00705, partial [Pseudomonadota bacterium]|nr:hypothetical protein [Pseudomonadota bacterium]
MPAMSVANLITVLQPGGQTQPRDLSSQLEAVLSYIKGAQGSKTQIPADFNQVLSQLMGPDLEQKDAGLSLDGKKAKDLESLVHSLIKGDSALDSTALVSNLQALLQQLQVLTQPAIGISPQVQSQVSGQILKSNDIINYDVTKVPLNGSSQSSPSGLNSRLGQYAFDAAPPVSSAPLHLTSLVNANPFKGADKENGLGVVFENPPQTDSSLYPIGSAHLSALPGLSANLADFRQFLPEFKIKQETSTPSTLQGVLGTNLSSSPTQQVSVASVQHVGAAFGSPVWPDDFSQKIVLLAGQQT